YSSSLYLKGKGFNSIAMCHNNIIVHRCGYRSESVDFYTNVLRSNVMGKKIMCTNRSSSVSNQADSLCIATKHKDCELRKKGGNCVCCICNCGEEDEGPNRYKYYSGSGCSHEICSNCRK